MGVVTCCSKKRLSCSIVQQNNMAFLIFQFSLVEWRRFLLWRNTIWHLDLKCFDNLLHSSTGWASFDSLEWLEWDYAELAWHQNGSPQTDGVRNSSQSYPENMDWYAAAWDSNRKRCTWRWHGVESFRLANQVSRSRWDYLPKFDWRAPLLDGPGLYLFLAKDWEGHASLELGSIKIQSFS